MKLSADPREVGQNVDHEKLELDFEATKPGFLYAFLVNENEVVKEEVFFDDFSVVHEKSLIIQQNSYYPFGLTFNSFQRENFVKNKFLYNAGSELQDDLDLGVYETFYRMLDPANGRWWQVDPKVENMYDWSPYNYSFNNPILHNDPKGDCPPGTPCFDLLNAAMSDAAVHPNGVGAHTLGVTQALSNSIGGLVNALSHPIQTLQGLGNLALAGVAGSPSAAMQMDNALGTNSYGAMAGLTNAISNGANNLINGNGIQRGTTIGEIGGAILGSKGLSIGLGAVRSTLSAGVASFGQRMFLSESFGITSQRFGSSLVNARGALNQPGGLFKAGWSNVASNGGGMQFRIGIGSKLGNPNQALFHAYVPKTFVPNSFANPSMQVKLSLFKLAKTQ
jgi:RHS repeat-associated protein